MREIHFRGKRVGKGGWVYGYYKYVKMLDEHIIVGDDDYVSYTVIPETVGQNTGLKDRDGGEIYEGDVLRNVDNPLVDKLPFKVVWSDYYGAWFWWSSEGEVVTDYFYQSIAKCCEIIGNIHEGERMTRERKEK